MDRKSKLSDVKNHQPSARYLVFEMSGVQLTGFLTHQVKQMLPWPQAPQNGEEYSKLSKAITEK